MCVCGFLVSRKLFQYSSRCCKNSTSSIDFVFHFPVYRTFLHSFVHICILSYVYSFLRLTVHSFVRLPIRCAKIHSFVRVSIRPYVCQFVWTNVNSLVRCTHVRTHVLTLDVYQFVRTFNNSYIRIYMCVCTYDNVNSPACSVCRFIALSIIFKIFTTDIVRDTKLKNVFITIPFSTYIAYITIHICNNYL